MQQARLSLPASSAPALMVCIKHVTKRTPYSRPRKYHSGLPMLHPCVPCIEQGWRTDNGCHAAQPQAGQVAVLPLSRTGKQCCIDSTACSRTSGHRPSVAHLKHPQVCSWSGAKVLTQPVWVSGKAHQTRLPPWAELGCPELGGAGEEWGALGADDRLGKALCPKLDGWFAKAPGFGWLW